MLTMIEHLRIVPLILSIYASCILNCYGCIPLEKEMATHSNILAWRIPWTSLVGYSAWGHRVQHN